MGTCNNMKHKLNRIIKHLHYLEKIWDVDFAEYKEMANNDNSNDEVSYSNYLRSVKSILIQQANTKFKGFDLKNFIDPLSRQYNILIDTMKLEAFVYNNLIGKVKGLNEMSGIEMLEIYLDDKDMFKKVRYLIF